MIDYDVPVRPDDGAAETVPVAWHEPPAERAGAVRRRGHGDRPGPAAVLPQRRRHSAATEVVAERVVPSTPESTAEVAAALVDALQALDRKWSEYDVRSRRAAYADNPRRSRSLRQGERPSFPSPEE